MAPKKELNKTLFATHHITISKLYLLRTVEICSFDLWSYCEIEVRVTQKILSNNSGCISQ